MLHVDTGRELRGGQAQLRLLVEGSPGGAVALPPDAPLRPRLEAAGIPVFPVAFRGGWWGGEALRRAARAFDAEVVAAHTSHAHRHALATGLPVVVHRRNDFAPRALSRRKYARALAFVAVSTAVRDVLVRYGVHPRRVVVVRDAVDPAPIDAVAPDRDLLRARLGWPADARVVLAVGALVPHKGHAVLLDALDDLPDVHLAVCGQGPLASALAARAARHGDRVRFLGHRSDVPRLLKSADVLAHPSLEEGLGQAVVEAMIAGCPVVATEAGGLTETVGHLGRLVPTGAPRAMARALRAALLDDTARATLAAASAAIRARHAPARMVADTRAVYVAAAHGRAPCETG